MNRRAFGLAVAGLGGTTLLAGCTLGKEVLLREDDITATTPETEWELELEEGRELELAVRLEEGTSVRGYVHRESGEEIATTAASSEGRTSREAFEVPATGPYRVSIEVGGATGTIILRAA